jgi:mono/diheme cytochrome c family protein
VASDKGVGPVTEITLGPVDTALASHGREIFDTKCAVCHKFEERYVGPALAGVTERRKPEWIMNMMLNPDEMIKQDPQAKALFAEYLTPMAFQNVTEEDAKAILMYFRSVDSGAGE